MMRSMMIRTRRATMALAVTAALVGGACSSGEKGGADKAGGSGGPVVLRMANTSSEMRHQPAVENFAERVETLSDGEVRIEPVQEFGDFAPDAEQQVVRGVADGEVDLGWVGTRVFDTMGVKSFQALTAPMLVDSYALQDAVLQEGIAEQMMEGLDEVGVVGLGVVPDALRKPIGVEGPIVTSADWRGITFGTLTSNSQAEAIRALGAKPMQVFGHERADALDQGTLQGFEFGLYGYLSNPDWRQSAPYVTANVNLWPQMNLLLADPDRFQELTGEQQGWLRQAADEAANGSAALADTDAQTVAKICDAGARFADATEADVAALHETFAPIYAKLEQDPDTKAFIDQIRTLKKSTSAEPALAVPAGCTGEAATQQTTEGTGKAPAELNGTYRYVITQADADKVGDTDEGYPQVTTIELKDGQIEGGCFVEGTYFVDGDRITFHSNEYDADSAVTFSRDEKGNLDLTPVPPMDPGDAFTCFSKVWMKIA